MSILGSSEKTDRDILDRVQQRATKMMKGMTYLLHEKAERAGTVPPGEGSGESH